jgi:hypothetical protein
MAAGVSRAGAISPEHHEWYRREHAGSHPPRREDAQQLWQWLEEELQQLRQQLQPQPQQPHEAQQQKPTSKAEPQLQVSSPATMCTASPVARAPLPVATSSTPACGSSSRSGSPVLRARDSSPGRVTPSAERARQGAPGIATVPLEQQAQQLTALCKGPDGVLLDEGLQLQRELYSAAFHELCR